MREKQKIQHVYMDAFQQHQPLESTGPDNSSAESAPQQESSVKCLFQLSEDVRSILAAAVCEKRWPSNEEIIQLQDEAGRAARFAGDLDRAEHLAASVIPIVENNRYPTDIESDAYLFLAKLLYQRRKYAEALSWYQKLYDFADAVPLGCLDARIAAMGISKSLEALGRIKEATEWQLRAEFFNSAYRVKK